MIYTIISAHWANDDCTAAIVLTKEVATVAVSLIDTPEMWAALLKWAKQDGNAIDPFPVREAPVLTAAERFTRMLSSAQLTIEDVKSLLK